jgi:hypothetical protein
MQPRPYPRENAKAFRSGEAFALARVHGLAFGIEALARALTFAAIGAETSDERLLLALAGGAGVAARADFVIKATATAVATIARLVIIFINYTSETRE